MAFDAHKNFAQANIVTPPSPANTGTALVLQTGQAANLPTPPFNATVWPQNTLPTATNAEIIRVLSAVGDSLTILRGQEGTTAQLILVGYQIAATITKKSLTDIEVNLPINPLNYGAVGNGITDDSAAVQAAINAVPDMGTLLVPNGYNFAIGTALIGGTSSVSKRWKLVGGGGFTTLGTNQILVHRGANDLTSDFFEWDGPYVNISQHHRYDQPLVYIEGTRNWRSNMPIFNTGGNKWTATALMADVSYHCECRFETFGTRAVVPLEFVVVDHSGAADDILIHQSTSRNAPVIIRSDPTKIPDCIKFKGYRGVAYTSDYDLNFETTLAALGTIGDTSVVVADASGLVTDKPIQIGRGQTFEYNWISSISGTTVNLVQPLRFAQPIGEPIVLGGVGITCADALALDVDGHWGEGYRYGARIANVLSATFKGRNSCHIGVCIDRICSGVVFKAPLASSGWPTPTPDNYLWAIPSWNTDNSNNTRFIVENVEVPSTATPMPNPPFYDPGGRMAGAYWRVRQTVSGRVVETENVATGQASNSNAARSQFVQGVEVARQMTNGNRYHQGAAGLASVFIGTRNGTPETHVTSDIGGFCIDVSTGNWYQKATGTGNTGWVQVTLP